MFSAFVRDISERRRTEAALRTAKEDAEADAEARSEFVAMMSHEIRTPLNGVIGMLNLALKTDMTPQQFEQLSTARRSADLLLAVTDDVLDFSKIEAGRLVLEETSFELGQVLDDVIRTLRPQVREGVRLSAAVERGLPPFVLGDMVRLRQILVNLVGNAVKFTSRGHVDLRVGASVAVAGSAHFVFTVEDTGIGIAPDQHERIFAAFTQADRSTTRQFGGTGLGLQIASRLSRLMSGTLRLVRSTSEGSVFELALPMRLVEADASPRTVSGHVLVVDDNRVNREIAAAMLRHVGCTVDLANNGLEALAAVERARYDLVLMDCQMPEMDGYDATRTLRARGRTPEQLPIVAMTAGALASDRERSLAAGMNDHISKPLLDESLMAVLLTWLPAGSHDDAPQIARTRERMQVVPGAWPGVVDAFVDQGMRAVASLGTAVAASDDAAVTRLAHDLQGSAGILGATRLAGAAAALEQAVTASPVSDCRELVDAIRLELEAVVVLLRTEHAG